MNLFIRVSKGKTLVYFLDLGAGLESAAMVPGDQLQLVIRGDEWDGKSGAEVHRKIPRSVIAVKRAHNSFGD